MSEETLKREISQLKLEHDVTTKILRDSRNMIQSTLDEYQKYLEEANGKVESLTQALRDIQDFDPNCYGKNGVCFDCPYCVTVKAIGEPDYEN
jgi:predicted translin family RNA/ssDNA-binding protein